MLPAQSALAGGVAQAAGLRGTGGGGVAFAALDAADVGAVEVGFFGERFLREAKGFAAVPDVLTKTLERVVFRHRPKITECRLCDHGLEVSLQRSLMGFWHATDESAPRFRYGSFLLGSSEARDGLPRGRLGAARSGGHGINAWCA